MKKTLNINGEVARIENNRYFILDNDFMKETTKENFKKEITKYKNVCLNSWETTLKNAYINMIESL